MQENVVKKKKLTTRDVVLCGILMALTTIMTMVVQIPIVGTSGYVNMGDTVVLFSALYLGRNRGALIGGLGSALADLITGYAFFAPLTLITKGIEGYVCGLINEKVEGKKAKYIAALTGGVIMVSGYFIGEIIMFNFAKSLASVGPNVLQAVFGVVTALLIYSRVKPSKSK